MNADRIPLNQLEYAKGVMSGLLNFSLRSGLFHGDGTLVVDKDIPETDTSPTYRFRCGYEHALEVAIRCIDSQIAKRSD